MTIDLVRPVKVRASPCNEKENPAQTAITKSSTAIGSRCASPSAGESKGRDRDSNAARIDAGDGGGNHVTNGRFNKTPGRDIRLDQRT